jgi:B12-binding domain/radical SAM domain protein
MLQDKNFNVEKLIQRLDPPVFGIDLHWLPHAQGAIEIARIVKRCHPQAKLVIGGLSASYYYRELFQYSEVDYVLRGDSTEEPLRQLMDCIIKKGEPITVPNLVWRDSQGRVQENPLSYVPADLGNIMVGYYDHTLRSVIRYRDLASYIPFKRWLRYPITAVLTCRGCTQNCVICGGSAYAFHHLCNREIPAFRSPLMVAQDVKRIERFTRGPIFILGDIRQPGEDYAYELLSLLKQEKVKNQLILELFSPASGDFLRRMGESCPNFCLEISPESHDPEVREAAGKHYSNQALEETLRSALAAGCGRLDVFFMIGLPKQTSHSVIDTIDYSHFLTQELGRYKRLSLFISPLAPFLDPGSLGFEHPDKHGYHILFRTLEEHRQASLAPSWKYILNYETQWMNREQIIETTYEAGQRLNRLKARYGFIPKGVAEATEQRIETALEILHLIDEIVARGDHASQEKELSHLKASVDRVSMSTVCEKTELELPVGLLKLKPLLSLWSWAMGRK